MRTLIVPVAVSLLSLLVASAPASADEAPADALGTAHGLVIDAVDPAGDWVVLCQARKDTDGDGKIEIFIDENHGEVLGDEVEAYFTRRGAPEMPIYAYIAHDPTGDWLVVNRDQRLILMHTRSGKTWDLSRRGALSDPVDLVMGPHGAVSFSPAEPRMLYTRKTPEGVRVTVRDLVSHTEHDIDPGSGLFYRAEFDPSGNWVLVYVVTKDTDGNGVLQLPLTLSTLAERRCRGAWGADTTWVESGDAATPRVCPPSASRAEDVPGFLACAGDRLVVRTASGALRWRDAKGVEVEFAPASLKAAIYLVAPAASAVVVSHPVKEGRSPLVWHKGKASTVLPRTRRSQGDNLTSYPGLWVRAGVKEGHTIQLNLSTGELKPVRGAIRHLTGSTALVAHGDTLVQLDLLTGVTTPRAGWLKGDWNALRTGPVLAQDGHVLHLTDPARSGTYTGDALAVSRDGRVLVATGKTRHVPVGPLRWVSPTPYPSQGDQVPARPGGR